MSGRHANNWDNRYDHERFFYGEEPNCFVAAQLTTVPIGRGLFLAEGEGRNAVHAASLGHDVVAIDNSVVGRRKALALAARRGVTLEYRCEDVAASPSDQGSRNQKSWERERWDFAVLCFAHLDPAVMADVHRRVAAGLAPGGRLILISFAKAQLGRPSGGPPRLEWLHDLDALRGQFPGVTLVHAVEREVELREAAGHQGPAMVIEIAGVKAAVGA